jgi:hypothetical protein
MESSLLDIRILFLRMKGIRSMLDAILMEPQTLSLGSERELGLKRPISGSKVRVISQPMAGTARQIRVIILSITRMLLWQAEPVSQREVFTWVGLGETGREVRIDNRSNHLQLHTNDFVVVVFQNTVLSDVINPAGWVQWSSSKPNTDNVYYREFGNSGAGAKGTRVSISAWL